MAEVYGTFGKRNQKGMINLRRNDIFKVFNEHFGREFLIYEDSFKTKDKMTFFIVKGKSNKKLVVAGEKGEFWNFKFEKEEKVGAIHFKFCELSHENSKALRKVFPNLNPVSCQSSASFGTGDRLGVTTAGHIRAFKSSKLFPFLAQQSVRENERTGRSWKDVLDDAIWGVFEAGYTGPFGADADHIKKEEDLLEAIREGFTMFTIDPSDYVRELSKLSEIEKNEIYQGILRKQDLSKYLNKEYKIGKKTLEFDEKTLRDAAVVYFDAINHVEKMYKIIKKEKKGEDFDFEVSVDETETPTNPLFHIFVAEELKKRDVDFQNLALRFIGDWQKGIDYIGDIERFREEINMHAEIARYFGGYKLSLHSGSDKFSVYPYFAESTRGVFHVKTAGTSYLEAIKIVAIHAPDLYRRIHEFALEVFEKDKASYHVTTDLSKIPDVSKLKDEELPELFRDNNSRQLIHITYGSVLNAKDERGNYLFRDKIFKILFDNEEEYYDSIEKHIGKHIRLLSGGGDQ